MPLVFSPELFEMYSIPTPPEAPSMTDAFLTSAQSLVDKAKSVILTKKETFKVQIKTKLLELDDETQEQVS
jgi:hypothetical protein